MSEKYRTETTQDSAGRPAPARSPRGAVNDDVAAALRVQIQSALEDDPSVAECKWSELFRRNNSALVSYLTHKLRGNREEAYDVAQEAYAKILGLGDASTINHLRAYLFRTARNIAIDRLRAQTRSSHFLDNENAVETVPCTHPPADEVLISQESLRLIENAISLLPAKRRYIFLRFRFNDESYGDIAADLGLSESMVRKHVLRAMRFCRTYLEENA